METRFFHASTPKQTLTAPPPFWPGSPACCLARSAQEYGAQILTYHAVVGIEMTGSSVSAVRCIDRRSGEDVTISCRFVINAAGAWSHHIAEMAGCHDVEVVPGRGIMIAMNHRLVNTVINRCKMPADGDIIVPVHTVAIIGTTDERVTDPENLRIEPWEVNLMLEGIL